MKLSEALKHGLTLRGENHRERFLHVEGRGLTSDAWGAACEAVQPAVAKFNWNHNDVHKFERAMDALRAVQHHYFEAYFHMPARCPLSSQRFVEMGGRIVGHDDNAVLKTYDDYAETKVLPGVTSECDLVEQMAGMVDHLFYAHGWSREKVAEVVEWYENQRMGQALVVGGPMFNFEHLQVN